ncbi:MULTISPECIES: response regulator [unclassified Streptomyces]|uniref:Transcriptional regulatory protein n=1 Tax=Streptomyces johnsoniae TaxID=3075532 RepID=A0ABU2SC41_9ACTN|nr:MULTISPECIES: response regulator [unclassified Streptomyces]MDT0446503.1 response regulator [Streptomyces sp. DSM 41886]ONK09778.1 Transcriptional regulatory protein CitT [Streptomyces sp. MP131-18]
MISVLVVDDDFMVARLHRKIIERTPGFTVASEAHTGASALDAVARLRPDLVLLDLYLPDLGGLEVLRRLRAGAGGGTEPDVLVVTAAREAETVRSALRGGAVHYVIKPFEAPVLQQRLRDYERRHRQLAAMRAPGQEDVDRIFGTPAASRMPKGLSRETAALVRRTLIEADGDLSAAECAAVSGLSRGSARRYLEYWAATGRAGVSLRYGATGRPERRFHWSGG